MPLTVICTLSPAAWGQASSSSDAAGTVTDSSGAKVPGAMVHVINNGTKAERITRTNDSGEWSVPNIPPTNYSVRVEKEGFKTSVIPSLEVEIGKTANGSATLAVGGSSETIEVSTLPPQLQTQEATVGQVIDQKQINDLPLNGRSVLQLAALAPGVSPPQTGQTGSPGQFGSRQLYITVDGGRGSSTNYVLDGTYVRSVRFNNLSLQPNVDTPQEFNRLRSTFSTEYGQGQAVVSMVTNPAPTTCTVPPMTLRVTPSSMRATTFSQRLRLPDRRRSRTSTDTSLAAPQASLFSKTSCSCLEAMKGSAPQRQVKATRCFLPRQNCRATHPMPLRRLIAAPMARFARRARRVLAKPA